LTKDTGGNVSLWDVTKGVKQDDYGRVDIYQKEKELFQMVSVPNWFSLDLSTGSVVVNLDYPQCFSAEWYCSELEIAGSKEDARVNGAENVLKGLFGEWVKKTKEREKEKLEKQSKEKEENAEKKIK